MALEHEIGVYRKRLPELLAHEGKFVVIHGDDFVGFADDLDGALDIGYGRFGTSQPFLVKRVEKVERVFYTVLAQCELGVCLRGASVWVRGGSLITL